jgi:hypothetical protein
MYEQLSISQPNSRGAQKAQPSQKQSFTFRSKAPTRAQRAHLKAKLQMQKISRCSGYLLLNIAKTAIFLALNSSKTGPQRAIFLVAIGLFYGQNNII